jgi:hypothetical protein
LVTLSLEEDLPSMLGPKALKLIAILKGREAYY